MSESAQPSARLSHLSHLSRLSQWRPSSTLRKRLVYAVAALLALWFLIWLGGPSLLRSVVEKQGTEALGRAVHVGRIDLRPWSLEASIEDLRIAQADGQTDQLSIKRLYVDASIQSLFRWAPVIDTLTVDQPRLVLRHTGNGEYDIDDILQRLAKPSEPAKPLPRFAVFNIALRQGSFDFVDQPVNKTHEVRELTLTIPFLSDIGSRRDVFTEPRLAFTLNGDRFDSQAKTTPFAQSRHTEASFSIPHLDLAPYLAYWPQRLPLRPTRGALQADLQVVFEQSDAPHVQLSGDVALSSFQLDETLPNAKGSNLLEWERLGVRLKRVALLEQQAEIADIDWQQPHVQLSRDANGRTNLERIAQALTPAASVTPNAEPSPKKPGWQVSLAHAAVRDARVQWRDATVQPTAALDVQELSASVDNVRWPEMTPAALQGSARLGSGKLQWSGEASDKAAKVQLQLADVPLEWTSPYLRAQLKPELSGRVNARADLTWAAATTGKTDAVGAKVAQLDIQRLALGPARQPLVTWEHLRLDDTSVQWDTRTINVGKLSWEQPQAQLSRSAQGQASWDDWFIRTAPATAPAAASATAAPPWNVTLADVQVHGGAVKWTDAQPGRPVRLQVSALEFQTQGLQPMTDQPKAVPIKVSLQLATGSGRSKGGTLSYQGQWRLPAPGTTTPTEQNTFATRGQLQMDRLPVHLLEPYFGGALNLDLLQADTGFRGNIDAALPPAGMHLGLRGDALVENFHANTLTPSEDLLDWKSLNLRDLQVDLTNGALRRLHVGETVLTDYFARVIVDETGRINLQNLIKSSQPDATSTATSQPASAPAATSTPPVAAPPAAAATTAAIDFGPISLVNGKVLFFDHFIKPNYSADITDLTGQLGAFSNAPAAGGSPALAALALHGRAEGSAILDVTGQLNPLAQPLAMDIKGAVHDLELPPLSPYTVKYAGYGVTRGKLSMDVTYKIEPDGHLTANNQIILNQLDFGERDPDSKAPNLPVKLAMALLADRNGVVNINLPISGSLNDPQFRVGPIIFRLIFNLIGKAITAPFALIAHALGGQADEFHQIAFAPGNAELSRESTQRLDQVAQVLQQRPALHLTVVGESDLDAERLGYQKSQLHSWIVAEKRRRLTRSGAAVDGPIDIADSEYPALLKSVYRRSDIPKPRNLIGMAKNLPDADMESLLLTSVTVTPDAMRELALDRGNAVRDYLIGKGIPSERLFLGAPRGKSGNDWKPGAELELTAR